MNIEHRQCSGPKNKVYVCKWSKLRLDNSNLTYEHVRNIEMFCGSNYYSRVRKANGLNENMINLNEFEVIYRIYAI